MGGPEEICVEVKYRGYDRKVLYLNGVGYKGFKLLDLSYIGFDYLIDAVTGEMLLDKDLPDRGIHDYLIHVTLETRFCHSTKKTVVTGYKIRDIEKESESTYWR